LRHLRNLRDELRNLPDLRHQLRDLSDLPHELRNLPGPHLRNKMWSADLRRVHPRRYPLSGAELPDTLNHATESWRVLDSATEEAAVRTARCVSEKLKLPGEAEKAAALAASQSEFPQFSYWSPPSIAQGNAGLCILWAYLDECFPDEGWDAVGRAHLELAVRGAESATPSGAGLFSGLGGLAFAGIHLSRGGTRYRRLLASLDDAITTDVILMAKRMRRASGISTGDFDVISGLSGIGGCLLCRYREASVQVALSNITDALVWLITCDQSPPAWYTPAGLMYDEAARRAYPNGNLNCGLAHGLPGMLAYLALVRKLELPLAPRERLDEAIVCAADWLLRNRADDQWGINWPTAVALTAEGAEGNAAQSGPSRSAWCYGAPGVARSLWLAGEAVGRADYRDLAVAAMEAVYRRPLPARMIDSPSFCHGTAGLLAITLRFARDTAAPVFVAESQNLTRQLLDQFQPDSLLGFRNIEYRNNQTDQPGLLDGAAGVAIVLVSAATGLDPAWDRLFLLS
jgi:lantibiotic biosynthesis protein